MAQQPDTLPVTKNQSNVFSPKNRDVALRYAELCWQHNDRNTSLQDERLAFEAVDKYYHRVESREEEETLQAKLRQSGDMTKIKKLRVPVVQAHVETAHSYLVETFLSGSPMFPVVSNKSSIDAALQLETIIDQHQRHGSWDMEFSMAFRDGLRYNRAMVLTEWYEELVPEFKTDVRQLNNVATKRVAWRGNKITRLDPYNTFYDQRVPLHTLAREGEYVGFNEIWPLTKLYAFMQDRKELGEMIYEEDEIIKSRVGAKQFGDYYEPQLRNDVATRDDTTDWAAFQGIAVAANLERPEYADQYLVTTMYCRFVPKLWGFGNFEQADKPQIWKLMFVNGKIMMYAKRLDNAHGMLPVAFCRPNDPNNGMQSRAMAEAAMPFQDISSSLVDVGLAAARKHVNDRFAYDASMFDEGEINNPNPSAKIRSRPSAYGQDLRKGLFHFPFQGNAMEYLNQANQVVMFANQANGQNQAAQGQFVKGNKTRFEYNDVMSNSNSRNRQFALCFEQQMMHDVKMMLMYNILQYQPVQELFNSKKQEMVEVNPATLREAVLEFKVADGLRPSEKLIDGESWNQALTYLSTSPQIQGEFNLAELTTYLFKIKGADIEEFKKSPEQQAFEQASQQWAMMAQMYADKGMEFKVPQPRPQDFNYVPGQQTGPSTVPTGVE